MNRDTSNSQPRVTLSPRGHPAMSADAFGGHNCIAIGIRQEEARDATKHHEPHRTGPTPQQRSLWGKTSMVPKLGNLGFTDSKK